MHDRVINHGALTGAIREIENTWIPMPDGIRLAARLWMPEDAEANPVPAILELIPYRKRDFMRGRDEAIHRYFAAAGYVSARVDVRGTGDSEGLLYDEYSKLEHEDAVAVIAWLADQPWCSGRVGMTGISWGGFNALQVAALAPDALGAIITLCAADDRYADDAHYMGGCLLNENMQWGTAFMMNNALPPDPEIVGEAWKEMWLERLEHAVAYPALWMQHQRRDAYWQHGSVCEDYSAIRCPVYAVGGWADGYTNAVGRLLAGLECPRKGLIGPWAHNWPHDALPGPSVGFLQEAVRWWDHWLKGKPTGIMDEPMLRVWMQESVAPQTSYATRPGRWVAEATWPPRHAENRRFHLGEHCLADGICSGAVLTVRSPGTTGLASGEWCAFGSEGELPGDQRIDDGCSLVFDSEPLESETDLLGAPVVSLAFSVDRPVAQLALRLNELRPDGSVLRVTYGLLNLCHRGSHAAPEALEPGRRYQVTVPLNDIAHRFAAGSRVRLAVSTGYWPMVWPVPEPVSLTIHTDESTLELPVRGPNPADKRLVDFKAPVSGPSDALEQLHPHNMQRLIEFDLVTGETIHTTRSGGDLGESALARVAAIDLDLGSSFLKRYRIRADDPLSARTELVQRVTMRRDTWRIRVEVRTQLGTTETDFLFKGAIEAFEDDLPVAQREWDLRIPRDHM
jgi:putative CocE/NonD family hydrolase